MLPLRATVRLSLLAPGVVRLIGFVGLLAVLHMGRLVGLPLRFVLLRRFMFVFGLFRGWRGRLMLRFMQVLLDPLIQLIITPGWGLPVLFFVHS